MTRMVSICAGVDCRTDKVGCGGLGGQSARLSIERAGVQVNLLPVCPFRNFANFVYPTLPMSFGRNSKSC